MKQALLSIFAVALGLAAAGSASAATTLETVKARGKLICGAVRSLTEAEYAALEKTHICCTVAAVSDNREPLLPHFHVEGS